MDKKRRTMIKFFKDTGFNMDIQTSLKEVYFLEITLNLQNGTYRPYKKSYNLYIHSPSNSHQNPQITEVKIYKSYRSLKDWKKILPTKKFLI